MKTAVIYSGQARTFRQVFPNQYWYLLRKLPNPEFFVSVAKDEQAETMRDLQKFFPNCYYEFVDQPEIPEPPKDPPWLCGYAPSTTIQGILRQLWSLNRAWEFYRTFEKEHELVVRIRPDIAFNRCDLPKLQEILRPWISFTPWWARWGGVNDRLALLGTQAAANYFTTFEQLSWLREKGCPVHPETLIFSSLSEANVDIRHTLATEFVTVRLDGTCIQPSINAIDLAEYGRTKV